MTTQVFLKNGQITIRETRVKKFPYRIEGDSQGFSKIVYENGKYIYKNYLNGKLIAKREQTPNEVRGIIKDVEENWEGMY